MKQKYSILVAAALGGLAQNLFKLALAFTGKGEPVEDISTYVAGMLIFGLIGMGFAWIQHPGNLQKAFYLGLSLPSIFQAGVGSYNPGANADDEMHRAGAGFIIPVGSIATEVSLPQDTSSRQLTIKIRGPVGPYEVIFTSQDGLRDGHVRVVNPSSETTLTVQSFASQFAIKAGTTISSYQMLSEKPMSTTAVTVEIKSNLGSGFLQSLGVKNVRQYQIDVKKE